VIEFNLLCNCVPHWQGYCSLAMGARRVAALKRRKHLERSRHAPITFNAPVRALVAEIAVFDLKGGRQAA
jgi:hypothetical protein